MNTSKQRDDATPDSSNTSQFVLPSSPSSVFPLSPQPASSAPPPLSSCSTSTASQPAAAPSLSATHDKAATHSASGAARNDATHATFDKATFSLRNVELIRTIGTGTFGRVMVVRAKHTKQYFALKILIIEDMIRLRQVEHVKNEKAILARLDHPFIVRLFWTKHDIKFLYMLFEYVCGGEIFTYLRNAGSFQQDCVRFYTAQIVSAIGYMHSFNVVYRDLKPENLLLDQRGHIKITDFGFAKFLKDRTYTMCGTPEYLAPEVIQGKGYNQAVDWWALGVLVFEMLVGTPPFYDENMINIYNKILRNEYAFPDSVDSTPKDFIKKLLTTDRTKRLGCMKGKTNDVITHKWFSGLDWEKLERKELSPPIVPLVAHEGDTRCYDKYEEQDWKKIAVASAESQAIFKDF